MGWYSPRFPSDQFVSSVSNSGTKWALHEAGKVDVSCRSLRLRYTGEAVHFLDTFSPFCLGAAQVPRDSVSPSKSSSKRKSEFGLPMFNMGCVTSYRSQQNSYLAEQGITVACPPVTKENEMALDSTPRTNNK